MNKQVITEKVKAILEKDALDGNNLVKIELADEGQVIHITLTGGITMETLESLAREFDGNNEVSPNIYGNTTGRLSIVLYNNKRIGMNKYEVNVKFDGSEGWQTICVCDSLEAANEEIEHQKGIEDNGDCEYQIIEKE